MNTEAVTRAWELLAQVEDPEIPVISLVDLGVVRDITSEGGRLVVRITPTYSGCPATKVIEESVVAALDAAGLQPFEVKTVLSPPWSTNMITARGRQNLRDYGIAPPDESADKKALMGESRQITCPNCGSKNTRMVSQFGSTPCKAHFKCNDCLEPFDYFKCL